MRVAGTRLETLIGRLDRRLVYLGLFVFTLAPLVWKVSLPLYLTEPPQRFYRTIEELPTDKVVFIGANWEAGTQAENRPQLVSLARHLIRRQLKFVLVSTAYPTSPQLANEAMQQAIDLEGVRGQWEYGRDWANLGYKKGEDPWYRTFTQNVRDAITADYAGTPLAQLPVMNGVAEFGPDGQISILIDSTGSNTIEKWYQFLGPSKVKIALGWWAVMAPEQYPFLDSGQLSGMLTGMKGAAEYERLLGVESFGTTGMAGQSFAHLYIFLLILLGNLSLLVGWWERRRRR
jgi:hypothetical protein